jgi:hypothetical protein
MPKYFVASLVVLMAAPFVAGCGDDPPPKKKSAECSTATGDGCEAGQVCEEVDGGEAACFEPLTLSGRVYDLSTDDGIVGARVVARDANGAALSSVAVTDMDGQYELRVPALRTSDGAVASSSVLLRADAADFLTFPLAPRVALPIDLSESSGDPPGLASALTDIGLIPIPDADRGTISGRILADDPGGTLVVAGGVTGIADTDGDYAIFNVPAGAVTVNGYLPGVNLSPRDVDLTADEEVGDIDLDVMSDATATVSGNVQIVNAGGGARTSVILVVESTFIETTKRGEAPPGFRAADVGGAWSIDAVPDGRYVALAAFENDELVRDPDTSIGGTDIVHFDVGADDVELEGFKVTGALAVVSPGATEPEPVSGAFDLSWEDDSSEDTYDLTVFDALGAVTWEQSGIVGPGGGDDVVVPYMGPALVPGMFYQFRAVSIKDGVPISATEDLKGVFTSQ